MGVCCVDGCEPDEKEDVTYFPFPIKPALRRKWRDAIKPLSKLHVDSKVCSRHFSKCDYERVRGKLRLKRGRVPSIFHQKRQQRPPPEVNGTATPPTTPPHTPNTPSPQSPNTPPPEAPYDPPSDPSRPTEFRVPEFGLTEFVSGDDSAENCTVECVPEAILHEDSDSNSETELHKEDIEDIIANYHIKQNKELADRLKPCDAEKPKENQAEKQENQAEKQENQAEKQENRAEKPESEADKPKSGAENGKSAENGKEDSEANKERDKTTIIDDDDDNDDDVRCMEVEVEPIPASREPVFIEISVDAGNRSGSSSPRDDCMMVLENVECDVDPAALMLHRDDHDRKEEPISLLTSSDEDDVILQEPHIDTVEVSDETDEDDVPLVKLVNPKSESDKNISKILWGSLYEYYCFECNFKTTKKGELKRHRSQHSTVIQMCEVCNFTSPSKAQFEKHKKKHRNEKRYKCHLCEYKAKHNMSLIYHLKSHEGVTIEAIRFKEKLQRKMKFAYKCSKCKFQTNVKSEMLVHVKGCTTRMYLCDKCPYKTKRERDLRRHRARRHVDEVSDTEDDEEYVPSFDYIPV